jgi:hypothetical protein
VRRRGCRLSCGWTTGGGWGWIHRGSERGRARRQPHARKKAELNGARTRGRRRSLKIPTREEEGGGGVHTIGLTHDQSRVRPIQSVFIHSSAWLGPLACSIEGFFYNTRPRMAFTCRVHWADGLHDYQPSFCRFGLLNGTMVSIVTS